MRSFLLLSTLLLSSHTLLLQPSHATSEKEEESQSTRTPQKPLKSALKKHSPESSSPPSNLPRKKVSFAKDPIIIADPIIMAPHDASTIPASLHQSLNIRGVDQVDPQQLTSLLSSSSYTDHKGNIFQVDILGAGDAKERILEYLAQTKDNVDVRSSLITSQKSDSDFFFRDVTVPLQDNTKKTFTLSFSKSDLSKPESLPSPNTRAAPKLSQEDKEEDDVIEISPPPPATLNPAPVFQPPHQPTPQEPKRTGTQNKHHENQKAASSPTPTQMPPPQQKKKPLPDFLLKTNRGLVQTKKSLSDLKLQDFKAIFSSTSPEYTDLNHHKYVIALNTDDQNIKSNFQKLISDKNTRSAHLMDVKKGPFSGKTHQYYKQDIKILSSEMREYTFELMLIQKN